MNAYTIEYSQPPEYRFSQDSVEAPRVVAGWVQQTGFPTGHVLDLCAGTGVMGLEFAFHLRRDLRMDFLEVQAVYRAHFAINAGRLQEAKKARGETLQVDWLEQNYETLLDESRRDRYDLILANPPYFRRGQGPLSPSDFKNRCRFFLDSTPESLWDAIANCLKPDGAAFVLVRPLDNHGLDALGDLDRRLRYRARIQIVADIRGTSLVRILKKN